MLARYVLHLEWTRGYRPHVSLRRAPRHGDRVTDGGRTGTLERCQPCGEGFLFRPDPAPPGGDPMPTGQAFLDRYYDPGLAGPA